MNDTKWVAMWGNAMSIAEHTPAGYAKNMTLRYPVYAPFSGDALRITLDNFCGTEDITISAATVGTAVHSLTEKVPLSCPVMETTFEDVTFDGQTQITIPAGERVTSDAISLSVSAGSTLCVSLYLENFTQMQSAVLITGPLSKGYFSYGNQVYTAALPITETKTTNWFYFLSNIDILTSKENHAIVCYGDSITAQAWPGRTSLHCA